MGMDCLVLLREPKLQSMLSGLLGGLGIEAHLAVDPDEALDAMTRQGLQDEVLSLVASSKATVVFVTHDLEEAIYLGDRVIGLLPHPGRIGIELDVDLPRPRDQLATREHPEFLRLRRQLFDFIKATEH